MRNYRRLCCNCMCINCMCIYRSSTWYSQQTPCSTKTKSKDPFTVGSVMKLWTEPRTKPHISRSKLKHGRAVGLITLGLYITMFAAAIKKEVSRDDNRCCETGKSVWWDTAAIHSSNYETACHSTKISLECVDVAQGWILGVYLKRVQITA